MTAKLKPIEPKTISVNGSRTMNLDNRPSNAIKNAITSNALPSSQHSPHIERDNKSDSSKSEDNKDSPANGNQNAKNNRWKKEKCGEIEDEDEDVAKWNEENENIDSNGCEKKNGNDNKKQLKTDENNKYVEIKVQINESNPLDEIPDVYKTQGTMICSNCTGYSESTCLCSSIDDSAQHSMLKRVSYLERRNWITTGRLNELRKKAQDAMKHHKIFTIRGCFYSIRKSLVQRGWVEKLDIHRRSVVNGSCQVIMEDLAQHLPQRRPGETRRQHIQKCERNIMSRFLEHMAIDFLWSARKEKSDWIDMARNPNLTINRFNKSPFTTKEGLCNVLRDSHWFFEEGKSETYYPRSYNVFNSDDLADFIDDYRLTACMSMLRFLVDRDVNKETECVYAENGQIPISSILFAMKQCKSHIRSSQNLDIDEETECIWNHEWELFLMHYQMLTQDHLTFQMPDDTMQWNFLMDECKRCLKDISQIWPQSNLDGILNIWIVKPSNRCRGRGILLMSDIKKIIAHVNPPIINKRHYVVQKYIERPMIIHNCKFDIRQWFLVTSVQPLIIWMYRDSYLRFSSQEYDLVNFHESVHLTNHAVQKRYTNGKRRDERLPVENMWDSHNFQAYLRQIGEASMWSERIFPGMQKAIIGTMLASQETMDRRPNTFELYGADFMISENFQAFLIEINASPDLGATTSVTARLCPQCLEDVIKVVIDFRNDPKASTGNFEMIYRQVIPPAPAYLGSNLVLKGTQVSLKNGVGKKEKLKAEVKLKIERKNSQLSVKPLRNFENEKTPIVSPRSFLIGFNEFKENSNLLSSARKSNTLLVLNKSNKENVLKNDKALPGRLHSYLGLTGCPSKHINMKENPASSRKPVFAKVVDSSRRHASCGPKLMSITATEEKKSENTEIVVEDDRSKIKCVGNKYGPEIEVNDSIVESTKSSPRKQLTPLVVSIRGKLKPVNTLSKSARTMVPCCREKPITNSNEYGKYLSQSSLQLNRMPSKLTIRSNYYNSHFYDIELSLRASQSKHNTNGTSTPAINTLLKGKNA